MISPIYHNSKLKLYSCNITYDGMCVCSAYTKNEALQIFKTHQAETAQFNDIKEYEFKEGLIIV